MFTSEEHDHKACSREHIMFTHETYTFTENTLKAESVHVNILCSQMKNMTTRQNNHVQVNILCSQMKHIPLPRTHSKQKVFREHFMFTNEEYDHKAKYSRSREHIMFTHETYTFTENTLKAESVHVNILCLQMNNMTTRQNNHVHVNMLCSHMKHIPSARTHSKQKVFT